MLPRSCSCLLALLLVAAPALAQVPPDYIDEPFLAGLNGPVGVTFDEAGGGYVWERGGRVYKIENGSVVQPPLVDLREEVGDWRDFGMLGFALDPEFLTNGRLYLYYVVDRHHLLFHGTPSYNENSNWYFAATIGRITRYEADVNTGFTTLVPGSRQVLLGATPDDGVPILYESHGTGSLCFGEDGSLLASSGDGANYGPVDAGSSPGTYWSQALADGIIRPAENVGAFRSQILDSLSGKLLRIDPDTGAGLPSNPFYEPSDPFSKRSRVWALGLRNPFRFCVRPGTGDQGFLHDDPGTLLIGDVGWTRWEELSVVREGGANLGWPLFEGLTPESLYKATLVPNLDAPNPLAGTGGCTQDYFHFQDLLVQERSDHTYSFPNPCDGSVEIAPGTPTFVHTRAAIDWRHTGSIARVPTFEANGSSSTSRLGDVDCPVDGPTFGGVCAVAGAFSDPFLFGPFSGAFLAMDFGGWMRAFVFDDQDQLLEVQPFHFPDAPVSAASDPADGSMLYVRLNQNEVRRLRYTGGTNNAPLPRLEVDGGPLFSNPALVRLDASTSIDPEGEPLTFHWDFGDGTSSTEPSPRHVFSGPPGIPNVGRVTLTVTDPQLGEAEAIEFLHFENTAPEVEITSIPVGSTYSTAQTTPFDLIADVFDAEHGPGDLSYKWQVFLRHDSHEHPETPITTPTSSIVLSPTPCNGFFYGYRIELTVTDPKGLSTQVERWVMPDCALGLTTTITAPTPAERLLPGFTTQLEASVSSPVDHVEFQVDGIAVGTVFSRPYVWPWTPEAPGPFTITALAHTAQGSSTSSIGHVVEVTQPTRRFFELTRPRADAVESPTGQISSFGSELVIGGGQTVGLRIPLYVPPGATIVSAQLEFSSSAPSSIATHVHIRAEATNDAAPYTGAPFELSSRPTTTALAHWHVEPWIYSGAAGERQRTPDLSAILQELVDRPGWEFGNVALLLIEGTGERRAEAAQGRNSRPARLIVEFD